MLVCQNEHLVDHQSSVYWTEENPQQRVQSGKSHYK
jgi:hypothetical protein